MPKKFILKYDDYKKRVVFISHGASPEWYKLQSFICEDLQLDYEEFNREPVAGIHTVDRLKAMLENSSFAFSVLTSEDEQKDGSIRARENVVHELGLFQGKLGFRRSIAIIEEGCNNFSNISGLTVIRFPQGKIEYSFNEIRGVLKRENFIEV